jgi:hypothetical protein
MGNRSAVARVEPRRASERKEAVVRDERGRKVETAVEARAGLLDRPILVVLCVSLVLAVIVFGALWLGYFGPSA